VRIDRADRRKKRTAPPKKPSNSGRKSVRRQVTFKSSSWYEKAALTVGISARSVTRAASLAAGHDPSLVGGKQ
jgi:hypothetical protein